VSVVGNSGSGKSTLAAALAQRLGVPHVELDAFKHQAHWTELPADEFAERVQAVIATDGWVIDGNYSATRDEIWARADTVVWLDPPRTVLMRQIIARTLRRIARRRQLWNGNRERWRNFFSIDPQQSVIAWAWVKFGHYRRLYEQASQDPRWDHLTFYHLASTKAYARLLSEVSPAPAEENRPDRR
jgi:adenylate kinase family enzyme